MDTTRTTPRTPHLLITLTLLTTAAAALTGCGDKWPGSSPPESGPRARQVAEAWDGSQAAEVWRKGYYPMGESVQLPDGAFRNEDDKLAYMTQNFVLRGKLPATSPKDGKVEWKSGGSLTLPLTGAQAAYETVARGGSDGPHLTVTGAKLGEMALATSRGPATVPAWMFTLDGYDTPLKQVALSPSKLPKPPIKPARETPTNHLMPLDRLAEVADDGRSVTVVANHGSCDDGPAVAVLETDGSVVLSASVVGTKDGPCTSDLRAKKVTVELDRPLADRILLDAFTGRPVPYGHSEGPSPSWS
ncbi:hypothetical protein [Streptomyces sp. NBC_00620]|uniref:hypothetical protein n=1 Tax=Streptomyces sp. NBC_00620 TaxID=2903666 RepID=UPI0022510C0E|nr:hypothetical protein [Streptomyces sp. NBC_00620]MCX4972443.1 hypothetical protein [Streptomyces sp. NBC_00620]